MYSKTHGLFVFLCTYIHAEMSNNVVCSCKAINKNLGRTVLVFVQLYIAKELTACSHHMKSPSCKAGRNCVLKKAHPLSHLHSQKRRNLTKLLLDQPLLCLPLSQPEVFSSLCFAEKWWQTRRPWRKW